ncbi:MAG: hypothetical protein ACLFN8_01480 [Candidatus Woesearchaeota archaeon]
MKLKDIIAIQEETQKGKNRSKKLAVYNSILDAQNTLGHTLFNYMSQHIQLNKQFLWADFGAGNQIALREAKYALGKNLKTYAVDVLERDSDEKILTDLKLQSRTKWISDDLDKIQDKLALVKLFEQEYAPEEYIEDIMKVKLNQKMDLITAVWVFRYVSDAMATVDNVIKNLKKGGKLIFTLDEHKYFNKTNINYLKEKHNLKLYSNQKIGVYEKT